MYDTRKVGDQVNVNYRETTRRLCNFVNFSIMGGVFGHGQLPEANGSIVPSDGQWARETYLPIGRIHDFRILTVHKFLRIVCSRSSAKSEMKDSRKTCQNCQTENRF